MSNIYQLMLYFVDWSTPCIYTSCLLLIPSLSSRQFGTKVWSNFCFLVECYRGQQSSLGTFHAILLLLVPFSLSCFQGSSSALVSFREICRYFKEGYSCWKIGFTGENKLLSQFIFSIIEACMLLELPPQFRKDYILYCSISFFM